ncbi:MAG: phosphomannomutase/phosphoglucomutase [Armatimonadota bacterium]|nr:MAG: phosphomannomutase/phosphoglucomutase [Armatimonadota bacterium]
MFRAYDIRGKVADELTPQSTEIIGRAFGTYIGGKDGPRVAIGHDNRTSSPALHQAFINGALSAGCEITDIGLATSPMLYFAVCHLGLDGGVNVTGSHNPIEYNGLKLTGREARAIAEEEIQEIRRIAEDGNFTSGPGELHERSVTEEYLSDIAGRARLHRRLKICLDCGNGTASPFAPGLLRRIGCEVVELYCVSDGTFPHHLPDPEDEATLGDLKRMVVSEKADLGVALDGDCDRLGVIDETGRRHEADELLILLARDYLERYPGAKVMMDVKSSHNLVEDIRVHGGEPVMYKTGHSLIKRKMKEDGIRLAGEVSGHMFFADDYYGFDDGLYAAARLLGVISKANVPLSRCWDGLPETYHTPELKAPTPEADKFRVVDEITSYFKSHYPVLDIDGARIQFPEGWALVRASNTNPYLTLRFEATSPEALSRIEDVVYSKLREYPSVTLPEAR